MKAKNYGTYRLYRQQKDGTLLDLGEVRYPLTNAERIACASDADRARILAERNAHDLAAREWDEHVFEDLVDLASETEG